MIPRVFRLLVLLVCFAAHCSLCWAVWKPIAPEFFGINGVGFLHYRDQAGATSIAERKMSLLKKAGAAADRTDFWWSVLEPERGRWNWKTADRMIDYYEKNGVEPFPILSYNAAWMKQSPASPQDFRDYAAYVRETVGRYRGRVRNWEMWNEPNIPTFWHPRPNVAHYTECLKAGYEAAKKANPDCVIVAPATSMTDLNFLLDIARLGGARSFDVLSIHPYSHSDGPEEMDLARQVQNARTVMERIGRPEVPIWITEMGWQADIAKPDEVEKQARFMVQSYVIAAANGVERLYWFSLQDWNENGKLEGWGMMSPKFEVKKSANAYRVMRDKLIGARFMGYHDIAPGRTAYAFDKGGQTLIVAWAQRGEKFDYGAQAATVTDIDGKPVEDRRHIRVIGDSPVYIDFHMTDAATFAQFLKPSPPVRENLLVNPSFETAETTAPYGWGRGVFYGGGDKGTFDYADGIAAHGRRSLAISSGSDALWQSWPVPALPGEKYTLSGSMKTEDATGENYLQILYLGGPGWAWKGGPQTANLPTPTTDWTTVTVTGTVPEDADIVRVNLVSKNNKGRVWFDNLKLTREDSVSTVPIQ